MLATLSLAMTLTSAVDLALFEETYDASRTRFREVAADLTTRFSDIESGALLIPSATELDLSIDWTYIPGQQQRRGLVIISSGVHGAEGFAGSAIQRLIAQELIAGGEVDVSTTGYLFIHAVNPYGFRHGRRVSENNVDLNRNFGVDDLHYSKRNAAYASLADFLNPTDPASASWFGHLTFIAHGIGNVACNGRGAMTQAIGEGQYEYPQGIMYGGSDFEPQQELLEPLILAKSVPYQTVLALDLHTGFGRRAYMHLLPNPPADAAQQAAMARVFGDYPIEAAGDGGDFYATDGDFSTYIAKRLAIAGKLTVPMLIEFGTVDSQTYEGSMKTLTRVVRENQAHWHGARSALDAKAIKQDFRELFFPSAADWRQALIDQVRTHIPQFLANFSRL